MPSISEKIKKKFKLFDGTRNEEEDTKILNKVQTLLFKDILGFLSQNLNQRQLADLKRNLNKSTDTDETAKIFVRSAKKIENFATVLDRRMDYFLNNLLVSSLRKKSNV